MKLVVISALALGGVLLGVACLQPAVNIITTPTDNEAAFPKPAHTIVVIEENHGFDQIIGSPEAPYINKLAKDGALFTDSHGVQHPSQPNYLAIFSGSIQGVKDDKCLQKETPYTTANLGAALFKEGYTFAGYGESMPNTGFMGCYHQTSKESGAYLYGRKHCPWVNWVGDKENNFPASVSLPLTEFPADYSKLPTLVFVIPNMDNDMHNGGAKTKSIKRGDQWLQDHIAAYVNWAKTHNSLLIITFDEDNMTPENHIPTFFVGPMVKRGEYKEHINHYNVLRTIEHLYRLSASGPAKAKAITDVWKK